MRGMRLEKNLVTFPGTEGDKGLWTWEDRVQYTELRAVPQVGDDAVSYTHLTLPTTT